MKIDIESYRYSRSSGWIVAISATIYPIAHIIFAHNHKFSGSQKLQHEGKRNVSLKRTDSTTTLLQLLEEKVRLVGLDRFLIFSVTRECVDATELL